MRIEGVLQTKDVAATNYTSYHLQGNGQRYIGVIWKTIRLNLKSWYLKRKKKTINSV